MSAPTAKLSFEIAQLRRLKFGKKSEQLDAEQRALFDKALDAYIAAAEAQHQELLSKKKPPATPGAWRVSSWPWTHSSPRLRGSAPSAPSR